MILRGLCIENWKCIRELRLQDLTTGVTLLHGPNRTGKSSLVKAVRACLYDFDHDSTKAELKAAQSWSASAPPQVTVEFETHGQLYRIMKVYSTKKDGAATLERYEGDRWVPLTKDPKEASRQVREILGVDASTAGINQLLWLTQGEVTLPEPGKLDGALHQQLSQVLGSMVTGADLSFRENLAKRMARWFTPKGGIKRNSSLDTLNREVDRQGAILADLQQRFGQAEGAIKRLGEKQEELPPCRQDMESAEETVAGLQVERERARERLDAYKDSVRLHEEAAKKLNSAEESLAQFEEAKKRWRDKETEVEGLREALTLARDKRDRTVGVHEKAEQELRAARDAEEAHRKRRSNLDDRQNLVDLHTERVRLRSSLTQAEKLETEEAEVNKSLENLVVPQPKDLERMTQNHKETTELRYQLQAAGMHLVLTPDRDMKVQLALDGEPTQEAAVSKGQSSQWSLRQKVSLQLPGWGGVQLFRGEQDSDLEHAAQDLERLNREYEDFVRGYSEDPEDEDCLPRLQTRIAEQDRRNQRLKALREQKEQLASEGSTGLRKEIRRLESEVQAVLDRQPPLKDWIPDSEVLTVMMKEFQNEEIRLEERRKTREADEEKLRRDRQEAEKVCQSKQAEAGTAESVMRTLKEELDRKGDEESLRRSIENAQRELTEAEADLQNKELTEAEKTIDQRLAEATRILSQRQQRLRETETEITRLSGVLEGNEGLHLELANAEAHLQGLRRRYARESFEAEAHRYLLDLFDKCRTGQAQQIMDPVGDRILGWAKTLGLTDYRKIQFGNSFVPEGLAVQQLPEEQPLSLGEESYGTSEQLSLLVRLALGGLLAGQEDPAVAILDDPLAHADDRKHHRFVQLLSMVAEGNPAWQPPAGPIQVLIFTCHPERFDHLASAQRIDLEESIKRSV